VGKVVGYRLQNFQLSLFVEDTENKIIQYKDFRGLTNFKGQSIDTKQVSEYKTVSEELKFDLTTYLMKDKFIFGDCSVEFEEMKRAFIKAKLANMVEKFNLGEYVVQQINLKAGSEVWFVHKKDCEKVEDNLGYLQNSLNYYNFSGEELKRNNLGGESYLETKIQSIGFNFLRSCVPYCGVFRTTVDMIRRFVMGNSDLKAVYKNGSCFYVVSHHIFSEPDKYRILKVSKNLKILEKEEVYEEEMLNRLYAQKMINYVDV
jgi:hypothetical protein